MAIDRDEQSGLAFVLEYIGPDHSYVIARQVECRDFSLPAGTRLGGRLVTGVSKPRALDPDGRPRLDLFAFQLRAQGLNVGQTLALVIPTST